MDGLTEVASNDDADGGLQSKVDFTADAGTTYRIAVDGYNGETGNITLHLSATSTDTTAPDTAITSGPSAGSATRSTTASFAFSSEAGATFECKLDNGEFAACASPRTYTALANGAHTPST